MIFDDLEGDYLYQFGTNFKIREEQPLKIKKTLDSQFNGTSDLTPPSDLYEGIDSVEPK